MPPRGPGDEFAGFHIEGMLGSGGMGSVYVARHPRLPRLVALKLLHASFAADPVFRGRFEREGELAGRLDHPNIVGIYDRGVEDDQLWIAMQYIEGVDAETALVRGQMPPSRAIFVAAETAKALDYAHAMGMLHRDVKPANILLRAAAQNAPERVLLTDFGIAKARDEATSLTQTGTLLATLRYASPEQLEGLPLDPRSDQYSLACTLFHLLTGRPPYASDSAVAVIKSHLFEPVPRLSSVRPDLPSALDDVFGRGLAKRPDERFGSCTEFAEAARQALAGETTPARKRRWWPYAALALVVAGAVGTAVLVTRGGDSTAAEPTVAPTTSEQQAPDPWATGRPTIELFPDLLPTSPDTAGFRDTRCSFATRNPDALWEYGFNCTDGQGVELQVLAHDTADTVSDYIATLPDSPIQRVRSRYGEQLILRTFNGSTGPWVLVQFASEPRSAITFQVFWDGHTQQEVIDEWVLSAPF